MLVRSCLWGFPLLMGCSAATGPVEESEDLDSIEETWSVNDVSVLFPHPPDDGSDPLLPMQIGNKTLVPESVVKVLGNQEQGLPFLIETPERSRVWQDLRVVAARIDPCFDAHEPQNSTTCIRQVRLSAQLFKPGLGSLSDASVHLFYILDDPAFVKLLKELRDLRVTDAGSLRVHPTMQGEGADGPWAQRFKQVILDTCDASNLSRMTFMATGRSGNNWFWGIVDKQPDGSFAPTPVPMRDGSLTDGFHQEGKLEHDGSALHSPLFPDEFLKSSTIAELSDEQFMAGLEKLQKIENPTLLATHEVGCASCHVGATTLAHAIDVRGLAEVPTTASSFIFPSSQNVANSTSAHISRDGSNMHAFSWFNGEMSVSQRAIHESARVAAYLSSQEFLQSLPESLRAEYLPR